MTTPQSLLQSLSGIQLLAPAPAQYLQDTGAGTTSPYGVIVVKNAAALPSVLKICNETKSHLWPIAAGKNFGYGTALPAQAGGWILDLSELKDIEFDTESGIATIGPGVTQGDLYAYLASRNLQFMVPTTGAGPNGSILGNALDGGYGLNPVNDHFDAITSVSGLWGSGEPFNGTFDELNVHPGLRSWKKAIGPLWTGLFHQSNLGVVTSASIALIRRSPNFKIIVFQFENEGDFWASMPGIRDALDFCPSLKAISFNSQLRAGITAVSLSKMESLKQTDIRMAEAELLAEVRKSYKYKWVGLAPLYGTKKALEGTVKDIKKLIHRAKILAIDESTIKLASKVKQYLPLKLQSQVTVLENAYDLTTGIPNPEFLSLAYARDASRRVPDRISNPARDGCGVLWYAPLLPLNASTVSDMFYGEIQQILHRHGFLSLLALSTRSGNVGTATIPILFDKSDSLETERAKKCLQELIETGLSLGFPPYRWGSQEMGALHASALNNEKGPWASLKEAFDPNNIIAPGRYLK